MKTLDEERELGGNFANAFELAGYYTTKFFLDYGSERKQLPQLGFFGGDPDMFPKMELESNKAELTDIIVDNIPGYFFASFTHNEPPQSHVKAKKAAGVDIFDFQDDTFAKFVIPYEANLLGRVKPHLPLVSTILISGQPNDNFMMEQIFVMSFLQGASKFENFSFIWGSNPAEDYMEQSIKQFTSDLY